MEEVDATFSESRNYLLFGGLFAVAANAYAIVMPLISGQPEAPAEETEATADEAPM